MCDTNGAPKVLRDRNHWQAYAMQWIEEAGWEMQYCVYVPRVLLGNVESFGERAGVLLLPGSFGFGRRATVSQVGKRGLKFCEKVLCGFLRVPAAKECQR